MTAIRNVLFVMCDQLRRDFVSCYGASPVPTPNIDRIAALGVRFDNAFVQSGVCGPSRMSFYTARYMSSHGATWNHVPLSAAEQPFAETACMTDLALDWIRAQGERPWVLHLSYVNPHWPYVAPAPFHAMFRGGDSGPIRRGRQDGTADEHPVVAAYRQHDECKSFA